MKLDVKIKHKGQILVAVPLLFSLIFLAILTFLLRQAEYKTWQEMHSKTVVYESGTLQRMFHDAGIAMGGYALTKSPLFRERYDAIVSSIPKELKKMQQLVGKNPSQKASLNRLERATKQGLDLLTRGRDGIESGSGIQKVRTLFSEMRGVTRLIGDELERITEEARKIENEGPMARQASDEAMRIFVITGVIMNIMLTFVLAYFFSKGITNRLAVLTENTQHLAKGEALAEPLEGTDEIAALDKVFHDMAQALEEARRKERAIIENMLVSIIILDRQGRIESINPQAVKSFGYQQQEVAGKELSFLFPEWLKSKEYVDGLFVKAMGHIAEVEMMRSDGNVIPVEFSLTEFNSKDEVYYMANILDVSEREEYERLKREFVSTVSHELRTPLTSIRGSLTLLHSGIAGELTERGTKMVAIAERNTIRLINLITDILDVEKIQAGKMELVLDDIELATIIERSLESVRVFADEHGVKVIAEQTTARLHVDADRIQQVIINLLSNAIKFSPQESTVKIAVQEIPGWVELQVIDQGRGIPAKFKQLVFEKFQQVEVSDAKRKGGTGLGLPICKGIIEQHQGTIGVESEEGKGSTFWFKLPTTSRIEGVETKVELKAG